MVFKTLVTIAGGRGEIFFLSSKDPQMDNLVYQNFILFPDQASLLLWVAGFYLAEASMVYKGYLV